MPIDPRDGFPDDRVRPAPPPLDDGYPDDWFVPPSAQGAGFPDDWVGPVTDAPSAPQAAIAAQPGAMASARFNPHSTDSFAAFLPFMPLTRAAMGAWRQPGDAFGQLPVQVSPPALRPLPAGGLFGSPTSLQPTSNAPPFKASILFGGTVAPNYLASDAFSPTLGGNNPFSISPAMPPAR
jgi:hypothetical protein